MMQVQRIERGEFLRMRQAWNELLAASGSANIHLEHEWLAAWAETMGNDRELLILRICEGDETVGFAPLVIQTLRLKGILPYRQIVFLGDPQSDFSDFVIRRDRAEALRALFRHLLRRVRWGELLLHNLPEPSPNVEPLRQVLDELGLRPDISVGTPCYYIPVKGRTWDEYLAKDVNPRFVSGEGGVQKRYSYYKKTRWEIQETTPASFPPETYEVLARLHEGSQRRKERDSIYREERFRAFLERVAAAFAPHGWLRLHLLQIDGRPASYILGFEHQRVYYHWNIGFDPEFEKFAPSKFLLWHLLRDGFGRQRWDEFNFMRGATDYKTHWTQKSYNLFQVRLLNPRGRYGLLNRLRRPGRKPGPPASDTTPS